MSNATILQNHNEIIGNNNLTIDELIESIENLPDAGSGEVEITLQEKSITPTTSSQDVTADSDYDGLSKVTINAVTSSIDNNITASNIKSGVNILGVTGTLEEGITPSGELAITENGTYDVTNYASAEVNVATSGGDTTIEDALLTDELETYTNDRITTVGPYALAGRKITSVSFPNATTIECGALYNCKSLTEVNIPNATTTEQDAFHSCTALTSIDLPKVTTLGSYSFYSNSKLASVSAPLLTTIGAHSFRFCSSLEEARFPCVQSVKTYAFHACKNVKLLDFDVISEIAAVVFNTCSSLTTLILRKTDAICTLANVSAFTGTPIANGTGYVYVPDDLVEEYKVATNWSTYAEQIKPLSELEG